MVVMRRWLAPAALVAMLPAAARAQTIEITPVVGYRFGGSVETTAAGAAQAGSRLEIADAAAFGVHLAYRVGEGELELLYARQNSRLQSGELFAAVPVFDLALETWQLGGNVVFGEEDARARPFVGLGVGLTRLLPGPKGFSDETRFSFSLGGGAKLWLARHLGLRLEGRWFLTVLGADSRSICGGGSCAIAVTNSEVISQADLRAGLILRF